jgi:hypothetical protein
MDLCYLHLVLVRFMDLNLFPYPIPRFSSLNFRFVIRKKVECREILVRKYGVEGFNNIVASEEPLILLGIPREVVFVFILV